MKSMMLFYLFLLAASFSMAQTTLVTLATSLEHRPTGIAVSADDRVFVNFPYSSYSPQTHQLSVVEVKSGQLIPYPNPTWNQKPKSSTHFTNRFLNVQSLTIDADNDLWILDTGSPRRQGIIPGGARIIQVGLATDRIRKIIVIDSRLLPEDSYLNDLRINKDQSYAYVTDSKRGGLLVINLRTAAQQFRLRSNPRPKHETARTLKIEGRSLTQAAGFYATDGIAYDSAQGMVYYQYRPFSGSTTLLAIQEQDLQDFNLSEIELVKRVHFVGQTVITDGIKYHDQAIYLTDLERNAISRFDLVTGQLSVVISDPALSWPDSIDFDTDGHLYTTTPQFHRLPGLHLKQNLPQGPFKIFKIIP